MSQQGQKMRVASGSELPDREGRGLRRVSRPAGAMLAVLILAIGLVGACNRQGSEESPPEQAPTNTAIPLVSTSTSTAMPPPATSTATAQPTETVSPTPTPLILATATATATGAAMEEPSGSEAIVTVQGDMNVRSGPGIDAERIGGATAGEEFVITGRSEDGEWWQIDYSGETGWIYAPFVLAANAENVPIAGGSSVGTAPPAETGQEPEVGTATILEDVNVRRGPSTEEERIGGAYSGQEYVITGKNRDGDWWQIDFEGQAGWVYGEFVTATNGSNVPVVDSAQEEDPAPEASAPNGETAGQGEATVILLGEMNIRSGAGTDYGVIGTAAAGQEFVITGKNSTEDWWQIEYEGQSGWLYAPFVVASNAEGVPVANATPVPSGPESSPTTASPLEPGAPAVTFAGEINVRTGPGTVYPVIGGSSTGQQFAITGKNPEGDWWRIDYYGQAGWVDASLVTATNAENVEVANVIPAPPADS